MASSSKRNDVSNIKSYLEWSDKGKSGIGTYIKGTIYALIVFFILAGVGVIPFTLINPDYKDSIIETNLVLLFAFLAPFLLLPVITKRVNKRPWWSVAMPRLQFEKWNFATGFVVATVVTLLLSVLFNILGFYQLEYAGFDWGSLIILTLVGFVGIFIQASSEEMMFRGYLTQFTRRITKNPVIFIFIPALLFSLPHISNVANLGGGPLVLVPYIMSGILYGWAAYKTGSLWMGTGLHLSNNLANVILIGPKDDVLKTVAPFVADTPSLPKTTFIIFIQVVVTVLVLIPLIRKRQKLSEQKDQSV